MFNGVVMTSLTYENPVLENYHLTIKDSFSYTLYQKQIIGNCISEISFLCISTAGVPQNKWIRSIWIRCEAQKERSYKVLYCFSFRYLF